MSRNIFTSALIVAMLVILVAGNVQAQTAKSTDLNASATLLTALTISPDQAVAFGNVSAVTPGIVYLNPNSGGTSAYVGIGSAIGKVSIGGAMNQSIRLSWDANIALTSGANSLNYVLEVNGNNVDNSTPAVSSLGSGNQTVSLNASGEYFLFVGGKLGGTGIVPAALDGTTSPASATAYTGHATFTVEYN